MTFSEPQDEAARQVLFKVSRTESLTPFGADGGMMSMLL